MLKTLFVETRAKSQFVNITEHLRAIVRDSGVASGVLHVFVPHTTAGITINENADPSVIHDFLRDMDRLLPLSQMYYRHAEGNSASHLKTSIVGTSQTVVIQESDLLLGTWQGIYLCEFDGPRRRTVHVKVSADAA